MSTLMTIIRTLVLAIAFPGPTLAFAAAPRVTKAVEHPVGPAGAAETWKYGAGNDSRRANGEDASKPIAADRTALHGTAPPPPLQTVGALAGGYTQTCYMYDMSNGYEDDQEGHLLACRCYDIYSRWHYTTAHLNERLGNDNGRFVVSFSLSVNWLFLRGLSTFVWSPMEQSTALPARQEQGAAEKVSCLETGHHKLERWRR